MKDNAARMRQLTGMLLLILFITSCARLGLASDQSDIRNNATQLRLTIARFDQDRQKQLKNALKIAPDRVIQCKNSPETLENCLTGPYQDLTRDAVILKPGADNENATSTPLTDVRAAEDSYALYNDRMNKTNDLLSRAGLALYVPQRELTPDIDDLRKRILAYMQDRMADDLRYEKFFLVLWALGVLAAIFGGLYLYLRRFKG